MKTYSMLALFAVAIAATACGAPYTSSVQPKDATTECSLSLPASSTQADVQTAVEGVAEGTLDPCSGSLANWNLYSAELVRIDQGDGPDPVIVLLYRMMFLHPGEPKRLIP